MQKTSRKLLLLTFLAAIAVPCSITFLGCSGNKNASEPKSEENTEKNNQNAKKNQENSKENKARRAESEKNLKEIAFVMLQYNVAKKRLPQRATFDKDGKPLLSWRVEILPYLDRADLYEQFNRNEPWDSPHNKKLIPLMPKIYRNPNNPAPTADGTSDYVVPTGPGSIFEGQNRKSPDTIRDGPRYTMMVVEINPDKAVIWTKPDDLDYDTSNPKANLGKAHPGGFNAAFADGHVQFLKSSLKDKTLLQLFQMKDRELFNEADLQ